MSGRARLLMWAVLFVASVALFAYCEGHDADKGNCDTVQCTGGK